MLRCNHCDVTTTNNHLECPHCGCRSMHWEPNRSQIRARCRQIRQHWDFATRFSRLADAERVLARKIWLA